MATKTAKKKPTQVSKSAITGHYVTKATVKRHPDTTVTQTVTKSKAKKPTKP